MKEDLKKLYNRIVEVLGRGYLMSLATVDEDGPWCADVIYVHQPSDVTFKLYWISHPNTRHSRAIVSESRVAATITAAEKSGAELGLQLAGTARKVDGPIFEHEKLHRRKRGKEDPTTPGEILEDESWWVLEPKLIYLIDTANFGFDRQLFEL